MLAAVSSVAFFAGGNLSRGETEDRSNRWVLIVFIGVGLLLGYLPAYTDREDFWTLDGDTLRWIGVRSLAWGRCCGFGPSLFWATASAAWLQFNMGTPWLQRAPTGSCAIRATWDSSLRQSAGHWRFARPSAFC